MLFDAASGDYWLLSPLASRIVRALELGEQIDPPIDAELADGEDWDATLERLRQVGLIAPAQP